MRDGSQTRKRLERCALTLFVKKGINATTIKDIANETGIAEGTLYRHYESKDALAQHLFLASYEKIVAQLKDIAKNCPHIEQKIKTMVHFFCAQYDEDPTLFHYLLLTQHSQVKVINQQELNIHELLVALFADAIHKKEIPNQDPHFCASVVMGIVLQAAINRVYGRIDKTMLADEQPIISAILGALHYKSTEK